MRAAFLPDVELQIDAADAFVEKPHAPAWPVAALFEGVPFNPAARAVIVYQ